MRGAASAAASSSSSSLLPAGASRSVSPAAASSGCSTAAHSAGCALRTSESRKSAPAAQPAPEAHATCSSRLAKAAARAALTSAFIALYSSARNMGARAEAVGPSPPAPITA